MQSSLKLKHFLTCSIDITKRTLNIQKQKESKEKHDQLGLRNNLGKANINFSVHVWGAHTADITCIIE